MRKGGGEFGMRLHRQRRAVGVEQSRMRRKRRMENRLCLGGWLDDLVLMRTRDRDLFSVDRAVIGHDIIDVAADPPALLRLAHHAAQRLSDQLMAKADPDHWNSRFIRRPYKAL